MRSQTIAVGRVSLLLVLCGIGLLPTVSALGCQSGVRAIVRYATH
jgi:hypothetical protein